MDRLTLIFRHSKKLGGSMKDAIKEEECFSKQNYVGFCPL